jgi:dihydroorotate dehydrogenase (NAD+) catalytic subunit
MSVPPSTPAGSDLSVQLGPLRLVHPLINASGTMEIFELADVLGAGILRRPPVAAYVPKTVTLEPRVGNPPPRILETTGGMINAIGLSGEGLEAFAAHRLPRLLALPCPLILSIGGFSIEEYVALASGLHRALDQVALGGWVARVGLEANISCPNVHSGCASIGSDPAETGEVVSAIRAVWPGLLVVKLTPNVTDITLIARAAVAAGADAIAAVNTYKGLVIDRQTLRPYLGNIVGGLSGAAIKPLALRTVYELFAAVEVPIVGMGGVTNVQDVLEFMSCGARVVAVGSGGFREPCLARSLAAGLAEALQERGIGLGDLVGRAHAAAS